MALSETSRFKSFSLFCREAVAKGSESPEQLAKLAQYPEPEIRAAVIANPATRVEDAYRLVLGADCIVTELTFSNESLPLHIALKFAEHPCRFVRATAARSVNAPAQLLEVLADDIEFEVVLEVAQNPTTPVALLINLAQKDSDAVRVTVARNPNAPVEALRLLIADREISIRSAVARRPGLPADLFRVLSNDDHDMVRYALASNHTLTESELEYLWQDSSAQVRRVVAHRKLTSGEWLAKSSQESVLVARRTAAADGWKGSAEILKDLDFEVASNEIESPEIQEESSFRVPGSKTGVPDNNED